MPKLGRSYTVDVLLPNETGGALALDDVPNGFSLLPEGRGAFRITARDRDRFGDPVSLEHLLTVLCAHRDADCTDRGVVAGAPELTNTEWHEGFRHGR